MTTASSNGTSLMVQGRIVWTSGNLFTGQVKKDDRTKQVVLDQQGNPVVVFGFGLAIPKMIPQTGQFTDMWIKLWQTLQGEALTLFPGGHVPQGFSYKFKDGDVDIDKAGVPYSKREGYAGHIVLACTTQLPIKYFRFEGGNNILVNDGFKNGDYVNVQLNIKAHPAVGQGKAGIYVNPSAVQLIQPGKEIINTPSGDQVFGMSAPSYAGQVEAHQAPMMPNMGMPGQAPAQQQQYPAPGMPQQNYAPPAAPAQAQPHYGVIPGSHQPAPQQQQYPAPGMPPMGNGVPQGTPQYPNQGSTQVNGGQYPSNTGTPATQPAYPSNNGMPPMPGMPR